MIQYGDPLVRFAYTYVHDRESAQDVVQEALFRAWQEQKRYPDRMLHAGWLYTVTHNIAIDFLRKRKRERVGDLGEGQAPLDPDVGLQVDVEQALARLVPQDRESLWLFYYQEWPIATIAQHYRVSVATIKGRLYRARQHFAHLWKEGEDESRGSSR